MVGPALLVIDFQNAIDDPVWAKHGPRNNPDAEIVVAGLLAEWRGNGWPIVHVKHNSREPGSTYRPGQNGNEFKTVIAPLAGEAIVAKSKTNAFIDTNLAESLTGIETLFITGVITNNSVEATVRMAGDIGFRVYVVEDGCFTFPFPDWRGRMRTADEIHAMSLANMAAEYATITQSPEKLWLRL